MFGWLANPNASLEELTRTATSLGIDISPQALDQRFTYEASECLRQILDEAVGTLIAADPVAIPVLQRFNGVYIQDSSVVVLPDELSEIWPGCGGSTPKNTSASVKLQVRLNMKLNGPFLQAGRVHDKSSRLQEEHPPQGALRIADLGYFSLEALQDLDVEGVYWLSRFYAERHVPHGAVHL